MQKGFTVLYILFGLLLLIVVAGGAYWIGISKNQAGPSRNQQTNTIPQPPRPAQQEKPTATASGIQTIVQFTPNLTANWKTHGDDSVGFSIKHPPDWVTSNLEAYGDTYGYEMRGNQSWIRLVWGSGFGGQCLSPSNIKMVAIYDRSLQMCHTPASDTNRAEGWSAMQGIGNVGQHGDIKVQAVMDTPSTTNRQTVLTILSTLKPLTNKPN